VLDAATQSTLTLSHSIDRAIYEKAKAEEVARSNALDTATQTTLILSQAIDSAIETIQKAIAIDSATSAALTLSNAIDSAVQEQEQKKERKRLEELAAAQEMERLELEKQMERDKLTAEEVKKAELALAEKQRQEQEDLAAAEKQKRDIEQATAEKTQHSKLTNFQYGWPEDFKDLPVIPVNDIKSYTDLIKLNINSDKDHNYNHEFITAESIRDEPLSSNLVYLPAGIFDKKSIDNSGALHAALSAYKTILEKVKINLSYNKITTDEIRRIADKSLTSDADLNKWIEQKINGRGGVLDKAMKLIS
jgi:hypothetical protein